MYTLHLVGRAQGCCPLSYHVQESLGPHMPETAKNNSWGRVFYSGRASKEVMAQEAGGSSGGRKGNIGCCLSQALSQALSVLGITPRHTIVPWEVSPKNSESEGLFPLSDSFHLRCTSVCRPQLPSSTWV